MSPITVGVLLFSLLGAVDYVIGSKLGIGKEFEKAFSLFGPMALSMDRGQADLGRLRRDPGPHPLQGQDPRPRGYGMTVG